MRRLEGLGLRHLRARPRRALLTGTGITLGVALFVGSAVASASLLAEFEDALGGYAGRTDVVASSLGADMTTLPAGTEAAVAALEGVDDVVAGVARPTAVFGPEGRETSQDSNGPLVLLLALEPGDVQRAYDIELADGRLPAGADEVALSPSVAAEAGVRTGDTVRVVVPSGLRPARVVGTLAGDAAARLNFGRAVLSAPPILGPREPSFVAADLAPGTDVDVWLADHADDLGGLVVLERAGAADEGVRDQLRAFGAGLTSVAMIVLFVGAFLIQLTLSIAVAERVALHGTLRALGASQAQVVQLVVTEALLIGTASTLAGLLLGLGLARALTEIVARVFQVDALGLTLPAWVPAAGLALGLGATLLCSVLPARRAARSEPALVLRGLAGLERTATGGPALALALVAAGVVLSLRAEQNPVLANGATGMLLLGAVLAVPPLLRPLARGVGWCTRRLAPGVGAVPVMHLVKERSRSARTLALVMVVLAMVLATANTRASFAADIRTTAEAQEGADLQLSAAGGFPADVAEELAALPGVGPVTVAYSTYGQDGRVRVTPPDGEPVTLSLTIIDPATYFDVEGFRWADGDDGSVRAALNGGGGVLVTTGDAERLGVQRGDALVIDTLAGPATARVAGVYASGFDTPPLVVGLPDARRWFEPGLPSEVHLDVAEGADPAAVRRAVEDRLGDRTGMVVTTGAESVAEVLTQLDRILLGFWVMLVLAGVVGVLGLANTIAISVLERLREIGLLRALGAQRREVRAMALVESLTLTAVAVVLAVPLGLTLSVLLVRSVNAVRVGTIVEVHVAWQVVPVIAVLGVLAAALAAWLPARRAGQLEVVDALRYE